MEYFPDHILVKILQHMNFVDLKNCMLLNSKFYDIICTNSSLNNKFKLNLRDLKLRSEHTSGEIVEALLICERKFQHAYVSCSDANNKNSAVLEKVGIHIKTLEVLIFTLNLQFLLNIFNFAPNVKTIKIFANIADFNQIAFLEQSSEVPEMKNLKSLNLRGVVPLELVDMYLGLFSRINTLQSVTTPGYEGLFDNVLKNQPNLIELVTNRARLFSLEVPACNFSLKKFNYDSLTHLSRDERTNLATFLDKQPEICSLKMTLSMVSWQVIMQAVVGLKKLVNFEFNLKNLNAGLAENVCSQNFSLKTLSLKCDDIKAIGNIVLLFPGVEILDLQIDGRRQDALEELFETSFEHLERLKSVACSFSFNSFQSCIGFRFKNLKELKLVEVEGISANDWEKFFTNNSNITSIELMRCEISNEMILIMAKTLKKLEKLLSNQRTNRPKIDPTALKTLGESCINLKLLKMTLGNDESDYEELFKELKKKDVKVSLSFSKDSSDE